MCSSYSVSIYNVHDVHNVHDSTHTMTRKKRWVPMDCEAYFSAENQTQAKVKVESYARSLANDKNFLNKLKALVERWPEKSGSDFWNGLSSLCLEYGLDPVLNGDFILARLIDKREDIDCVPNIYLRDFLEEAEDPLGSATQEAIDEAYPIGISLSPYVTKNDLLEYVEDMWSSWIQPQLESYREPNIKLGATRKHKAVTERNKFICAHRDLHPKKILELLRTTFTEEADTIYKYKPMEPNYIRDIIRTECKDKNK